jgi:probable HAF family extracellular repeat protein
LGGPTSLIAGASIVIDNRGTLIPVADTAEPNPNLEIFNPFVGQDPFVSHAATWRNGKLTDLGALPGGHNTYPVTIDPITGVVDGFSETGETDPVMGFPAIHAVIWGKNGVQDLGTLGGYESLATQVDDVGRVIGLSTNSIPDSFPEPVLGFFLGSQTRAFLWENGQMRDLGTLGGPDAEADYANEHGQITGVSYTSFVAGPSGIPPVDPFLWENGKMLDLGSFGGTYATANDINNRGEIVGSSNLAGDSAQHPYLWTRKGKMRDLGTLGGDSGIAYWLNDSGEVAGVGDLPGDQIHHAFRWRHGHLQDLGTIGSDPCSNGFSINARGQIIGTSTDCNGTTLHAALWEPDGTIVNLQSFVPPDSGIQLNEPDFISDRGEIAGRAFLSNGDEHAFVLVPCDSSGNDSDGCRAGATSETSQVAGIQQSASSTSRRRNRDGVLRDHLRPTSRGSRKSNQ